MAQVLNGNQVKLNSGKVVQAQSGGWYDGQQFWNGSLGAPGVGNNPNQTDIFQKQAPTFSPQDAAYIKQQQAAYTPPAQQPAPQPAPQPVAQPTPQPAPQPVQQPQAAPSTPGGATPGVTGIGQPTINLPQLYEGLYAGSGIRDTEAELTAKTNAYNEQVAKIKDNPYLSEATMTGRIKKLEEKFSADTRNIQNTIAMKKADIETQLNLQTKQFDINSDQTKLAWDQFNTLLSAGSLDNASGEDIAQLTRSTGISSSMIQSAIGVSRKKNAPKVNTQVIQVDDGTSVSAVVINQDTGDIISKQILGASKPKSDGGLTKTEIKEQEAQQNQSNAANDAKNGATLQQLVNHYGVAGGLSIEEIYRIYNSNTSRGQAKESLAQVKQGIFANQKGFKTEAQIKAEQKAASDISNPYKK